MDAKEILLRTIFGPPLSPSQCEGILKNGIRCRNKTTLGKYCSIHRPIPSPESKYREREARLRRLLELNAPAKVVVIECELLLRAYYDLEPK
jgi:hypothetical protein